MSSAFSEIMGPLLTLKLRRDLIDSKRQSGNVAESYATPASLKIRESEGQARQDRARLCGNCNRECE